MTGTTQGGQKSSMGGTGDPHKASPAAVERYLKGSHFPASKDELVDYASQNDAPDDVMDVLNNFSDQEYESVIEVAREVGRIDARSQDGRQQGKQGSRGLGGREDSDQDTAKKRSGDREGRQDNDQGSARARASGSGTKKASR
ncbi:MAG: DUF2795 domain-containing protein [Proteobacteria bacterium]|nr:DUF2795 domain-containing protein [Pseudomonadota bacterium]